MIALTLNAEVDNLLTRLFSYCPRSDREPLEDFCTETLAWCLRNSCEFRREVFRDFPELKRDDKLKIVTQQSYRMDRADVEEFETLAPEMLRGRFDMLVKSEAARIVVGFESKVWARFGKNQMLKYRRRLEQLRKSLRLRRCYLISITASGQKPEDVAVDAHFRWSTVQVALMRAAQAYRRRNSFVGGVCRQFATFLEEKGLAPMKIPNPTPKMLDDYLNAMKFRQTMEKVLVGLKGYAHLRSLLRRRQVRHDSQPDDDEDWLGIYAHPQRQIPYFYLGFGICGVSSHPRLKLLVEMSLEGDQRRLVKGLYPKLKPDYLPKEGVT